jgi:hypothetical protein
MALPKWRSFTSRIAAEEYPDPISTIRRGSAWRTKQYRMMPSPQEKFGLSK